MTSPLLTTETPQELRDEFIRYAHGRGFTIRTIARALDLSETRVRQIIKAAEAGK